MDENENRNRAEDTVSFLPLSKSNLEIEFFHSFFCANQKVHVQSSFFSLFQKNVLQVEQSSSQRTRKSRLSNPNWSFLPPSSSTFSSVCPFVFFPLHVPFPHPPARCLLGPPNSKPLGPNIKLAADRCTQSSQIVRFLHGCGKLDRMDFSKVLEGTKESGRQAAGQSWLRVRKPSWQRLKQTASPSAGSAPPCPIDPRQRNPPFQIS